MRKKWQRLRIAYVCLWKHYLLESKFVVNNLASISLHRKTFPQAGPGRNSGQNSISFYSSFFWLVPYAGLWLNKMNLVVEP